jgi:hypothetical protein
MWTVVPAIYNEMTTPHIQSSIFNWTYLRCCWRYLDNSVSVILQTWCQIQHTTFSLRNVYCGPDINNVFTALHIQAAIFNWTYLRCNWRYSDTSIRVILQTLCQIQRTSSRLRYVNCGPGHIQCSYICAYSVFSIQLNVSATLLEISRQFNARYTANLEPYTAHILQFILCGLWSRPYTMKWQHRIFSLQYSTERICAAIGNISTIQWELYCNLGAKYRARSPVYALSTVVPDIYNVITVTYIQASKFKWTNMRCYWRYPVISMCVKLPTWCQIQRTSSILRYLNCDPRYIECNYSSEYSGFNIQLNIPALPLEICRHLDARYTAILVPNTAHVLRVTLCQLWSRTYAM